MKNPDKKTNYTDAVGEIYTSLAFMDPAFAEAFIKTVTSNSIDVYPNPDHGKQSIQYAQDLCALKRPALVFLNYKGLIDDKSTIAHEMGHAIDFYSWVSRWITSTAVAPFMRWRYHPHSRGAFHGLCDKNYDRDTALQSWQVTSTIMPEQCLAKQ